MLGENERIILLIMYIVVVVALYLCYINYYYFIDGDYPACTYLCIQGQAVDVDKTAVHG